MYRANWEKLPNCRVEEEIVLVRDLRASKTPKVVIVLILALTFSLATSIAESGLIDERLQVIDSQYQDNVFGGANQPTLRITFVPGNDLVDNGNYAVIVDVDGDGNVNDEPNSSYVETGAAIPNASKLVTWNINEKLTSLKEGSYQIFVVIDNLPNGTIDWGEEVKVFDVKDESGNIGIALSSGTVHDDLRNKFDSLSDNLTISGGDPTWKIVDKDKNRTYIIRKSGDKLDVYQKIERDEDAERFTLDKTLEITEVDVDPDTFSPNGDGVNDTVTIYYTLSESLSGPGEEVVITIGEDLLVSPARPTPDRREGRNSVVWNGKDGVGNYVEDDTYTIKIVAKDGGGSEVTATIPVKVRADVPEVISTIPGADSYVSALTEVSAQLKDNSGEGIDLEKSKIWSEYPSGDKMDGSQRDDGENAIRWIFSSPLPGDGSADGEQVGWAVEPDRG